MIPEFEPYHSNLQSVFLRFDKYLQVLQQEFFNGYIDLDFGDKKCAVLLVDGDPQAILLCLPETSVPKSLTPGKLKELMTDDSFINSYKCSPGFVEFLTRTPTAKLIYDNLTSDKISPGKLIEKCKVGSFSGTIEANTEKKSQKSYLYFDKGNIIGGLNIDFNDNKFTATPEDENVHKILEKSSANLYEFARQSSTVNDVSGARDSLIQCYEQIFKMLEENAVGQDFSSLWRINARKLSEKYSFLDPFVAEFSYENQKIDLWEEVDAKQAARGMDELCEILAKSLRMPKDGIKDIKDNYKKILVSYEVRN